MMRLMKLEDRDVLDVLHAIYGALVVPENWIKNSYALDAWDFDVEPSSPSACCFCLRGALDAATVDVSSAIKHKVRHYLIDSIRENTDSDDIVQFNDDPITTHRQVVNVMEHAIINSEELIYG